MSIFAQIVSREPIDRGWSADRKFRAQTADGEAYFLRLSPPELYERRKQEFERMEQVQDLGVRMCDPVEFGLCAEGNYTLLRWIPGRDAEWTIPELDGAAQYAYGLEAGRMLRTIHTLPAPEGLEPWAVRYGRKMDAKIAAYEACPMKYEGGELFLDYLWENRHLLAGRPQVCQHGDFHCGNLMFDESMRLTVIDFDRADFGDPWQEFNRIIWDVRAGERYACGMVDGYFGGDVPEEFWRLLALYESQNMLSSLPWAVDFGEEEIRIAVENARRVLGWYDDMKTVVPRWYHK